jgi:hypothetical protein
LTFHLPILLTANFSLLFGDGMRPKATKCDVAVLVMEAVRHEELTVRRCRTGCP